MTDDARDAARYRFLRGDCPPHSTRWPRWVIQHWASPGPTWYDIRGADLDAAIDASMRADRSAASSGERNG